VATLATRQVLQGTWLHICDTLVQEYVEKCDRQQGGELWSRPGRVQGTCGMRTSMAVHQQTGRSIQQHVDVHIHMYTSPAWGCMGLVVAEGTSELLALTWGSGTPLSGSGPVAPGDTSMLGACAARTRLYAAWAFSCCCCQVSGFALLRQAA
jgi:hypothetical protein